VDCHGAHAVTRPNQPRSRISQTCAACHQGVSATYAKSVHGRALNEEKNADVPTCTDCHQSHAIAGPHAPGWRLKSPELCASCHANPAMMKKYDLSTNVMQTYLADFHGMTASLQKKEGGGAEGSRVVALCIDCHGVHDITKTDAPHSAVMKANVTKTCQRCHPGASQNFSAAWLSHYEPTFKNAPLVYSVKIAYYILIPFMIGGLVLQILLHLWRVVVNR
jgi:predicted CXXCH cytochrome family protein